MLQTRAKGDRENARQAVLGFAFAGERALLGICLKECSGLRQPTWLMRLARESRQWLIVLRRHLSHARGDARGKGFIFLPRRAR